MTERMKQRRFLIKCLRMARLCLKNSDTRSAQHYVEYTHTVRYCCQFGQHLTANDKALLTRGLQAVEAMR